MRSLILLASFAVFSLPAISQPAPAKDAPALPQKTISVSVIRGASGAASNRADRTAEKKVLVSPNLQAALQRGLMEARARADECFTIETFAPLRRIPSRPEAEPYMRQTFALRSTCSAGVKIEQLPTSRPVKPRK